MFSFGSLVDGPASKQSLVEDLVKVLFHHLRADWDSLNNYEFAAENRVMISFREGEDESSLSC